MVALSTSRGNNRYGGVRQEQFLRNTNNVVFYLCSQELVPGATRDFLVFCGQANISTVSNSLFCDYY